MTEEELIERHPKLWHMAADGMWPFIQEHGLLSVSALLDRFGIVGDARVPIEAARRPECVELDHPEHGRAIIRDNKPMFENALAKCLEDGLVPEDWYRILNAKSFFWVDRDRLERLLDARAYAKNPQTVLEVDTACLIAKYRDNIRLARINTGQTLYVPQPRGLSTFKTIAQFPTGSGRVGTAQRPRIVELVVEGGVPDIRHCVIRVDRYDKGKWSPLWS